MAHVIENLVEQGSTSTGATTLVPTIDARLPCRGFAAVMADGDTTALMVVNHDKPAQWQAGIYRYSAGTLTLFRLIGSATGEPIDFAAGVKKLYIAPLAKRGEWRTVTEDFDAIHGDRLYVIGAVTVTLPLNPADGESIQLDDLQASWGDTPPTIAGNGKSIEFMGATDTSVQLAGSPATITFDADADLWRVA